MAELPANESCATATTITVPFEGTAFTPFATDDVRLDVPPDTPCEGLASDGADLVWRVDPGPVAVDLVAAVVTESSRPWSLYALADCDVLPAASCLAGVQRGTFSDSKFIVLDDVVQPFFLVLDRPADALGTAHEIRVLPGGVPPHDRCEDAMVLDGLPATVTSSNELAENDNLLPLGNACVDLGSAVGDAPDVAFRLTITQEMKDAWDNLQIDTRDASSVRSLIVSRNGCDLERQCVRAQASDVLTVPLSHFDAGDEAYVIVTGRIPGMSGVFTLDVSGADGWGPW